MRLYFRYSILKLKVPKMPLSAKHHSLFQQTGLADKFSMFRSLFDSSELTQDEALALLGSIHADLRHLQGKEGSGYAQYAGMMGPFQNGMPDVCQHVIANWKLPRGL